MGDEFIKELLVGAVGMAIQMFRIESMHVCHAGGDLLSAFLPHLMLQLYSVIVKYIGVFVLVKGESITNTLSLFVPIALPMISSTLAVEANLI